MWETGTNKSVITNKSTNKYKQTKCINDRTDIFKLNDKIKSRSILFARDTPRTQLYKRIESKIMRTSYQAITNKKNTESVTSKSGRIYSKTKVLIGRERAPTKWWKT